MERPGERLRQARERLNLTYRDVAQASRQIAARRNSDEFALALSRLADIENKGTVPTVYRLYTLCAIYRLDLHEVLRWYGIPVEMLPADAMQIQLEKTHAIEFPDDGAVQISGPAGPEIDPDQTTFLGRIFRRWGKLPLTFLGGLDGRHLRYGLIGLADWSMHPILQPGALVLIDQDRRKIMQGGWSSELDRPVYFLEYRGGFRAGWCSMHGSQLLVQPHPSAQEPPLIYEASEIDVVGQIVGVAMLLEPKKRRHSRTSAVPAKSPNP